MKKIVVFLFVAVMCFSLAACGGNSETSNNNGPQKEETIEITLDNWQNYFEFRRVADVYSNKQDEITSVYLTHMFCLKDDVMQSVKGMTDVKYDFVLSDKYASWFDYNTEAEELITKNEITDDEKTAAGLSWSASPLNGSGSIYIFDKETGVKLEGREIAVSVTATDNMVSFISMTYKTMEITSIQGSITIAE